MNEEDYTKIGQGEGQKLIISIHHALHEFLHVAVENLTNDEDPDPIMMLERLFEIKGAVGTGFLLTCILRPLQWIDELGSEEHQAKLEREKVIESALAEARKHYERERKKKSRRPM